MHHPAGAKGSHGTPVSSLRRTALQLSQAANSPVPRHAMRPASAPPVRPGGVGGGSDVTESNIKVYIRTRPAATINGTVCVTPDPGASSIMVQAQVTDVKGTPRKGRGAEVHDAVDAFVFEDGVLEPEVSQQDVFDTIGRPAAEAVLDGYNVTIFAYGQTGAGKTHTIYGSSAPSDQDEHAAGMAPHTGLTDRVMNFLIASASAETRTHASVSYRYAVSMLDIYDEKVTDLFDPGHKKKVREGPKGGVYLEGQRWQAVTSGEEASRQVNQGIQGRRVCHTSMNSASSRSHTICMFRVSRDEEQEGGQVMNRQGIITIVDLCGSERVKKSEVQGSRLKEAININSSLSALKTVITAIGDGASHVPFRSSKLTWVLKDCIGGNSKVAIIAHINPCSAHAYESVSTLRFVSVVKSVKTRVTKNECLKTEEEIAQEESKKAAASNQKFVIQEARKRWEHESPLPPPPFLALETADASTQVSPDMARRRSSQASDGHLMRTSGRGGGEMKAPPGKGQAAEKKKSKQARHKEETRKSAEEPVGKAAADEAAAMANAHAEAAQKRQPGKRQAQPLPKRSSKRLRQQSPECVHATAEESIRGEDGASPLTATHVSPIKRSKRLRKLSPERVEPRAAAEGSQEAEFERWVREKFEITHQKNPPEKSTVTFQDLRAMSKQENLPFQTWNSVRFARGFRQAFSIDQGLDVTHDRRFSGCKFKSAYMFIKHK